jgi:hypothetical protein
MGSPGFATMMLRRTKRSLWVRLALGAALCLSIAASFGLHPEPAGAPGRRAGLELVAQASTPSAAHGCIACMSGGTIVLWPGAPVVLSVTPAPRAVVCAAPLLRSRLAGRDRTGRSPPALA